MIKKIVRKRNLQDSTLIGLDLKYWLSRPPEERVAVVDFLRKQYHGREDLIKYKGATGRKRDIADLEALGEE